MAKTADAARGKWRGVLMALGVGEKHLTGKHTPCPVCGGRDRFRFDNQRGDGTWICSHCGAGSGFDLLKLIKGWDFKTAAREVDGVLGNVSAEPLPASGPDDERKSQWLRSLYAKSSPIEYGDPAGMYLRNREPNLPQGVLDDLRFCAECPSPEGGTLPAMLAVVRDCASGKPKTIHRTFLDGKGGKAPIERQRALMPTPGSLGAANIQLGKYYDTLGIAEGIETALAAQVRFDLPCWAAINTSLMAKWHPPEDVRRVVVFGDCDTGYGGQAAAFSLAHRLSGKFEVEVKIPERFGDDWASAA